MRKKFPIGIQTFREIREEAYYYGDNFIAPKITSDCGRDGGLSGLNSV